MNNTVVVIPARGGSKRFRGKNIYPFAGLPLLAHSILYAIENSNIISRVYVSTDNPEIKKVAEDFGAEVIDRPAQISGDLSTTVTAVQHAISVISEEVENIIILQPTNPLRHKKLLREAFQTFLKTQKSSLMTVSPFNKKIGKVVGDKYVPFNYEPGQRSQDLESFYYENGLLYIIKKDLVLQGKIFEEEGIPFVTNHPYAQVDIDTIEDLHFAEMIRKNYSNED